VIEVASIFDSKTTFLLLSIALLALISFNLLAVIFDSEYVKIAITADITSFTSIISSYLPMKPKIDTNISNSNSNGIGK